jgi:hypothetical protein
MPPTQPEKFYLLTYPRTASNLLLKILNLPEQSNILTNSRGGYYFMPPLHQQLNPLRTRSAHVDDWTPSERTALLNCYNECFQNLETHIQHSIFAGKSVFVKEHLPWILSPLSDCTIAFPDRPITSPPICLFSGSQTQGNQTLFADEWLKDWKPTFLIRNPILMIPSHYRTEVDLSSPAEMAAQTSVQMVKMSTSFSRVRKLYDWFRENSPHCQSPDQNGIQWPIILDADDIITSPELVKKYAKLVNLNPENLKREWDPIPESKQEEIGVVEKRMRKTVNDSAGILKGKTMEGVVMEEEVRKWKEEWGEEEGTKIEGWGRGDMADYELLREKRLRL